MTRIQTPSHGFQVYIFQADAERMRANRLTRWSLFGLWTHSSCPVIQHVRNAEENRGQDVKVKFGIELLGYCVDSSRREGQGYTNQNSQTIDGRKLTIYNHGTRLEEVVVSLLAIVTSKSSQWKVHSTWTAHGLQATGPGIKRPTQDLPDKQSREKNVTRKKSSGTPRVPGAKSCDVFKTTAATTFLGKTRWR